MHPSSNIVIRMTFLFICFRLNVMVNGVNESYFCPINIFIELRVRTKFYKLILHLNNVLDLIECVKRLKLQQKYHPFRHHCRLNVIFLSFCKKRYDTRFIQ